MNHYVRSTTANKSSRVQNTIQEKILLSPQGNDPDEISTNFPREETT